MGKLQAFGSTIGRTLDHCFVWQVIMVLEICGSGRVRLWWMHQITDHGFYLLLGLR
ncbi:unnamed protein product [Brassica oleracea var. botrytis]|uniref:(rape) hypothetical protein n=1 Tax=Brassica napus TaxID=3708 RepID=A0A816UDM2_BRANA|nr:unnamed protein product [Brassica napus]